MSAKSERKSQWWEKLIINNCGIFKVGSFNIIMFIAAVARIDQMINAIYIHNRSSDNWSTKLGM